jgi:hypothetical protein
MRVVQGGDGPGLALKALEALGVGGHLRRQDFHRHLAAERRIVGQKDGPHPALADQAIDAAVREGLSRLEGQDPLPGWSRAAAAAANASL